MDAFKFGPIEKFSVDNAAVCVIDRKFAGESDLIDWYYKQLRAPYGGINWDAFWDILRDLSWIPEKNVVIYHEVLPLTEKGADLLLYLRQLADASADWEGDNQHNLTVAFDPSLKESVQRNYKPGSGIEFFRSLL